MVTVAYHPNFEKSVKSVRDNQIKTKIKKQIGKIVENPEIGKPMRYGRKGTREVYVSPFRLSYLFDESHDKIIFLDFYHKDKQ